MNGVIDLLADNNFGDTRAPAMAGPTGLLIILLLVAATIFLIRNMSKRLKRLPDSFGADAGGGEAAGMNSEASIPEQGGPETAPGDGAAPKAT